MEKYFTLLGASALAALVVGLALAPVGRFPWEGLLCVHFVNIWLWIAAYIVVQRRHKEEEAKEDRGAASVLFLLAFLTVALILSSVHSGILLASEHGVLLGNFVFHAAGRHPLALALPHVLLGFGALAVLVTMRRNRNLSWLIGEYDAAREIRRLHSELVLEKQKLQTVVQGIRAAMAIVAPDGTVCWANDIYAAWFGRGRPLAGLDSKEILGVSGEAAKQWPHDRLVAGGPTMAQAELLLTLPSGEQRAFLVSAYTLCDEEGAVTGHLQLLQDVSEQREMHTRLMESEKLSAVGQLIGSVAHELNNPLAILMGYSEMVMEEVDDPGTLRHTVELIRNNTVRCHKVVKNLLSFVRKRKEEAAYVSVREPMAAVLELKRHQLTVDNVTAEIDCPADLPRTMIDEHKLQQVFLNLINNAQDAMVEARRKGKVKLSARVENGWIVARVADDGPGIPPGLREKVMSPFFTTKAPGKGTGLGLPICKSIVEEMGGSFDLASTDGSGTVFIIRLPIVKPAGEHKEEEAPVEAAPRSRILVVDDEVEILEQLRKLLGDAGHECHVESNARSALDRFDRGETFDLLLCDLKMPGMDGLGLMDELAARHPKAIRRICFLSGDTASPRTREQVARRGVDLIEKPYEKREILSHVNRALVGGGTVMPA